MLIFLSYARTVKEKDSDGTERPSEDKRFAKELRELLTEAGFTVWRDIESLGPGDFRPALFNALARSDAVAVVLSPDGVKSPWVEEEWQTAIRLGKPVIPVRWKKCRIPEELQPMQMCDFCDDDQDSALPLDRHHLAKLIRYLNGVGSEAGVYINYREGAKDEALVARLRSGLSAVGIRLWSDRDDAAEQTQWGQAAQRGLNQARLMLLIASQSSMHSRRVDTQIRYFVVELGKPVAVLLLDRQARMGSELIGEPWIDFTFEVNDEARYQEAWVQLLAELQRQGMHPQVRDPALATQIKNASQQTPSTLTREEFRREHDGPLALFKPPVLQSYTRYTKAELLIDRVKSELWVSGLSLIRLSELTMHFRRLAELANGGIRFLLIDPESEVAVLDAGRYVGRLSANSDAGSVEYGRLQRRMRFALDNLTDLRNEYPDRTMIRVAQLRPAMGYFIADPTDLDGFMTAYPYLYHIDTRPVDVRAPFLHLPRRAEERWFDVFKADFEAQWEDARPWP